MNSVNQLLALLPKGGWERLLCDALWQSALIAALGWLIARFLVRHAAARAWVHMLTATACIVVPLASAASRSAGWTVLARAETAAVDEEGEKGRMGEREIIADEAPMNLAAAVEVAPIEPQQSLTAPQAAEPESSEKTSAASILPFSPSPVLSASPAPIRAATASPSSKLNWLHTLALVWLTVSALLALRLACSALSVRKILRNAKPCDDARLLSAAAEAATRVGLSIAPPVLVNDRIESPMVLALGQPRLLVPHCSPLAPREESHEQASKSLTNTDANSHSDISRSDMTTLAGINWTAAFTHELAHVARRDGWSRLWMEIVAIALPLQPLVWLVRRSFHLACEEACDDLSVAAGSDPVDLAETLTAWLGCSTPKPATAIGMSSTKARVLRLLAMREKPIANVPRGWRFAGMTAALLLIAGLAVAQVPNEIGVDRDRTTKSDVVKAEIIDQPSIAEPPSSADERPLNVSRELIEKNIREKEEAIVELEEQLKAQTKAVLAPQVDGVVRRLKEQIAEVRKEIALRRNELAKLARTEQPDERGYQGPSIGAYTIDPPDILLIDAIRLTPKEPAKIAPLDKVQIEVTGTFPGQDIKGAFRVDSTGEVVLGPAYGAVNIKGLTRRQAQAAIDRHLCDMLADPVVALTIDESRVTQEIGGEHLVAPDGNVNLGTYGLVYIAGMTLPEARAAIEEKLSEHFESPKIAVDILAYNSKVYYVIVQTAEAGGGDNVYRFPINGNETVLDAIAQLKGLSQVISKNIWIARPSPKGQDQILQVKWDQIVAGGGTNTNYQILPGDRIFVAGSTTKRDIRFAPGKIRVELLDSDDPNTWRWKLYIPAGVRYGWKIAYDDIPKLSPPREGTSHIKSGYSNEPYYATSNEVLVTAKLLKLENGNWRMSVSSRINSESGEPTWQMSGVSAEIPAESLKWRGTVGSTDGQTLGDHGNLLIDAKDQIILLQSRPCQKQPDGSYLAAEGTAPGFMIWMEKWGEELSPDSKPQATPPATSPIPPQGSVLTPPETAPVDRSVPDALWPRPSMPNALDSNSPYRRSQSALKDTAKPAPPDPYGPPLLRIRNIDKERQPSYSVIVKNVPGRKDSVERFQYKGDETVLEAISQIQDLTKLTGVFVWILRPAEDPSKDDVTVDVDWDSISGKTADKAPPKLLAGDRVFITGGRSVTMPTPADTKKKADGDSIQSPSASQFPAY